MHHSILGLRVMKREREDLGAYGLMALGERDAELAPVPAPCVERVL